VHKFFVMKIPGDWQIFDSRWFKKHRVMSAALSESLAVVDDLVKVFDPADDIHNIRAIRANIEDTRRLVVEKEMTMKEIIRGTVVRACYAVHCIDSPIPACGPAERSYIYGSKEVVRLILFLLTYTHIPHTILV
jgi:hypothetical protein